jgi:uncharacterized membrane protein YbaN (DUF454 family)
MQLVVVNAVRNAVSAATIIFTPISINRPFFILVFFCFYQEFENLRIIMLRSFFLTNSRTDFNELSIL